MKISPREKHHESPSGAICWLSPSLKIFFHFVFLGKRLSFLLGKVIHIGLPPGAPAGMPPPQPAEK